MTDQPIGPKHPVVTNGKSEKDIRDRIDLIHVHMTSLLSSASIHLENASAKLSGSEDIAAHNCGCSLEMCDEYLTELKALDDRPLAGID